MKQICLLLTIFMAYEILAAPYSEFLAICPVSHYLMDDPIKFPGQPGVSHLHTFLGNQNTTANTTSLSSSDFTNCVPIEDKSAYWFPTLLNTSSQPVLIRSVKIYYENLHIDNSNTIQIMPNGLKMITGNSNATGPTPNRKVQWGCTGENKASSDIVLCQPTNYNLETVMTFPECWDGVNLDLFDHRSHMAYGTGSGCPLTHPVALPVLQYKITYISNGSNVHLSSGSGYSLHADAWIFWEGTSFQTRLTNCIHKNKKCGTNGL